MLHIKTILHPTDFSSCADTALDQAVYWSRRFGADLHLLHALSAFGACEIEAVSEASLPRDARDSIRTQRIRQMQRLAEAARSDDLTIHAYLARGHDPIDAVLMHARAVSADLIMLGTRGLDATQEDSLGHVAAGVMQRSTCPVFFTHGPRKENRNDAPGGRILVYLDFTRPTCALLELAGALAVHFRSGLDLVYVSKFTRLHPAAVHPADGPAAADEASGLDARIKQRLLALCTKASELEEIASAHTLDVQFHVRRGYAPDAVSAFAREHASDLLLMVAPGLSGATYAPLEAQAEHIVQQAPCPVLLINPSGTPRVDHADDVEDQATVSPGTKGPVAAGLSVDEALAAPSL